MSSCRATNAKALCAHLLAERGDRLVVEPFCGGLSMTAGLAAAGWRVVWERETRTELRGAAGRLPRVERLFAPEGGP